MIKGLGLLVWVAGAGLAGCVHQVVVLGAGDIAVCDSPWDEATASLADSLRQARAGPGRSVVIITAGDNVYPRGTAQQYASCHAPSWGRPALMAITRPAPGNHDYLLDSTAGPYFAYFGARAGPADLGYYSYAAGWWHVIALNSELRGPKMADQLRWLRADLARHSSASCVLAYWHRPVFSSGAHGNDSTMIGAWRLLYAAGADLAVTGHDHTYERFDPQSPDGRAEPDRGLQQFVAGTGGAGPYQFTHLGAAPNSAFRHTGDYGVLVLTLSSGSYRWEFITIAGRRVDAGEARCR